MRINQQNFRTIWPEAGPQSSTSEPSWIVNIIDQTCLPHVFKVVAVDNLATMIESIKTMQVRGAPLIGAAAAYGMALAAKHDASDAALQQAAQQLIASRPTAVNLQWAVQRVFGVLKSLPIALRAQAAWREAAAICDEDVQQNQAIGQHGLHLIRTLQPVAGKSLNILTHCNAGWLATVDYGTALAPIYAAHDAGMAVHVWVDETRPRNQGASLTAWELQQHGVPHTVIVDNAGGHLMQQGQVDMVIVGADRVTANGDVCNKIGTYLKALAAHDNHIPFYAAVPTPTIDWTMQDGRQIEIEERAASEVGVMQGRLDDGTVAEVNILPPGCQVANPAFDVTPARLVTGIITERGTYAPSDLATLKTKL